MGGGCWDAETSSDSPLAAAAMRWAPPMDEATEVRSIIPLSGAAEEPLRKGTADPTGVTADGLEEQAVESEPLSGSPPRRNRALPDPVDGNGEQ